MRYVIIVLFLLAAGFLFLFRDLIFDIAARLPNIEEIAFNIEASEVKKEVIAPAPLRAKAESVESFLTDAGVIRLTNIRRSESDLAPLALNSELTQAAAAKVQDMFRDQYFAHRSPGGLDAGAFAENNGYEYILIGENLALGNFRSDAELVQGWMDSPGHRANILNSRYQEIGVSTRRGTFEDRTTWLSVQIFGRPLANCPRPDESIRVQIENYDAEIRELREQLELLRTEIQDSSPKNDPAMYNQKVGEFNALVSQYNQLIEAARNLMTSYNNQVRAFNECIER